MQEDEQLEQRGGSLEKSLRGETKFDFRAIAQEAWQLSKNTKGEVLQGVMLLLFVAIVFAWLMQSFFGVSDLNLLPPRMLIGLKVAGVIITTPIIATMFLLGISHSVGIKPRFFSVFKKVLGSVIVILLALLLAAMSDLGSLLGSQVNVSLGFIALFYVNLATGFSIMLLVEKRLPPSQCVLQSVRVFHKYWLPLLLFYVAYYSSLFLGLLTFGFAYIWIIPFFINMKGILYRELFGIVTTKRGSSPLKKDESIFHA